MSTTVDRKPGRTYSLMDVCVAAKRQTFAGRCEARAFLAAIVPLQAQGQATQGRDVSTLAPLRVLRARAPVPAWARRAVGEGVKSCPRIEPPF
jgi:hypothetical protein